MRLANFISSPVSQDHFNWLCKAICTRVWARKLTHKFKPKVTPHGIHLLSKEVEQVEQSNVPILAVCMAWHVREVSVASHQIKDIIDNAISFNEPYDTLVIFLSPAITEGALAELRIQTNERRSPRRFAVSIVSWDEIIVILSQNQSLLKTYVLAGLKVRPGWFSSLPNEVVKKPRLPRRMPTSKKIDRTAPYVNKAAGVFSDTVIHKFDKLVKHSYPESTIQVAANNHLSMGYATGAIRRLNVRPFVLVDLWLLTSVSRDVERILSSDLSESPATDTLHHETLSWIRFTCQDKLKRELVWAYQRNNRNRTRDRATGELLSDVCQVGVHVVLFDPNGQESLESSFLKARAKPSVVLTWDDLFPNDSQDDCPILAEVASSASHLIVTQWKIIAGLVIENEYRISLHQVSENLARQIQLEQAFNGAIPHSHIVRLESKEVSNRSNMMPHGTSNRPTRLRVIACQTCDSEFLDLPVRHHNLLCAKCERQKVMRR